MAEPPGVTLDHEYDGIKEYDNRLPNWWLFTLYGAIVFSVLYWMFYETYGIGDTQSESWEREIELAAQQMMERELGKQVTNESLLLMASIDAQLEAGGRVYVQKCVQCHNTEGQGNVGPNLTDDHWLHGPMPLQIYDTVMNGVLDKGMQAWKDQLGPTRVRQVVAYLLTLKGGNVPGKEPQGRPTAQWEAEWAAAHPEEAGGDASEVSEGGDEAGE